MIENFKFDDEEIAFLTKHDISIADPLPLRKLENLEEFAQNPLLFLENSRFIGSQFAKFPDEQIELQHGKDSYLCFGKAYWLQFFVVKKFDNDNKVYWITRNDQDKTLIIRPINENIANFAIAYQYFLKSMHQIIAEKGLIAKDNDKVYNQKIDKLFEKITKKFKKKISGFDSIAFPHDKNQPSFWRTLYYMMREAELAFHLSSVSLMDYIETKRFGNFD